MYTYISAPNRNIGSLSTFLFVPDHQNYFGIDEKYGPVAISIKREKLKESNANPKENIWNYRVIVRTCEVIKKHFIPLQIG